MIRINRLAKSCPLVGARSLVTRATNVRVNPNNGAFGDLSESGSRDLGIKKLEKYLPQDPDGYDKEEFSLAPRKEIFYYEKEISRAVRQGAIGLRKALELFETMKRERIKPEYSTIVPIIFGCARAGYTRKAFEMYQQLLRAGEKPSYSMITCLINACGECPFPDYGLNRLKWVRDHMKFGLNKEMNLIQYNSAIKAYGKLGRLDQAGELVSHMIKLGVKPNLRTFNMLLMGCLNDQNNGTILALRVFKKMKQYGYVPDINSYNLLARCIRECGLGSKEILMRTFSELPAMLSISQQLKYKMRSSSPRDQHIWLLPINQLETEIIDTINVEPGSINDKTQNQLAASRADQADIQDINKNLILVPNDANGSDQLPNLLSDDHLRLFQSIEDIDFRQTDQPHVRMLLFGGPHGFLKQMSRDNCMPDLKTFCLMLDNTKSAEDILEIHRLSKDYGIRLDDVYYNKIIKCVCQRSSLRLKKDRALYYLEEMQKDGFRPSIHTFECLASCCTSHLDAIKLIQDVESCGFAISKPLIHRLFISALITRDLQYLDKLTIFAKKRSFSPPAQLIEKLEAIRVESYRDIVADERRSKDSAQQSRRLDAKHIHFYDRYSKNLTKWLDSVAVDTEEHPWAQFEVDDTSKRDGFMTFVHKFKALDEAKQQAIASGEKDFGNLAKKSEKIYERNQRKMESQRLASPHYEENYLDDE